jgi:hypothetical protein
MRVLKTAIHAPLRRLGFKIVRLTPPARAQELPARVPELSVKHVSGCRVFPNREAWLPTIPKGSTIAEIGVVNGAFF